MVNIPKFFKDEGAMETKMLLPLLPLRDLVVLPHMVAPLFVGRTKSVNALADAMNKNKLVFLSTQKSANVDNPGESDINSIGTIGKVLQLLRLPDGTVKALVEGKSRARIERFSIQEDFFQVEVEKIIEPVVNEAEALALVRSVIKEFEKYAKVNKNISKELVTNASAIVDSSQLADTVASHFSFKIEDKQKLLETFSPTDRLSLLLSLIKMEIEVYRMDQRIKNRVKEQMEQTQKNYYLNEQMRAIKKEMGADDDPGDDIKELEEKINNKKMSEEATEKVQAELKKLKMMTPMSAEATVVRNYIDWIISLPWYEKSEVRDDLDEAEKILDEDHYGLEKPKERILEYLAVQALVKKIRGPILCFVGPPGVGKTSLAKSIARATGRKYVRLSLGGVRDEAEIRGHRRTYIGALPGRILQGLKQCGVNNPVFMMDEIDKLGADFRGDPSSALLEALDPEQNFAFSDHFLNLPFDLSKVMFILTANVTDTIPSALLDRMEVITLSGYTEEEKIAIAFKHLIPRQIKENGLKSKTLSLSSGALQLMVSEYTSEAGLRNLEREIGSVCRKVARQLADQTGDAIATRGARHPGCGQVGDGGHRGRRQQGDQRHGQRPEQRPLPRRAQQQHPVGDVAQGVGRRGQGDSHPVAGPRGLPHGIAVQVLHRLEAEAVVAGGCNQLQGVPHREFVLDRDLAPAGARICHLADEDLALVL